MSDTTTMRVGGDSLLSDEERELVRRLGKDPGTLRLIADGQLSEEEFQHRVLGIIIEGRRRQLEALGVNDKLSGVRNLFDQSSAVRDGDFSAPGEVGTDAVTLSNNLRTLSEAGMFGPAGGGERPPLGSFGAAEPRSNGFDFGGPKTGILDLILNGGGATMGLRTR